MNRTASLVASVGFQILVWRLIWIARLPSVLSDGSNPAIRLAFLVLSPFGCSYVVPLVGSAYVFCGPRMCYLRSLLLGRLMNDVAPRVASLLPFHVVSITGFSVDLLPLRLLCGS